ncbi:class I SAM-dependent methyltransferase [uncultured Methanoregula sp.]|uniref:class I SAM-dependent methyltransferase n=1 Tax=uncultured Methanoregula sp. TaxID=1005933 RepID=UPI002AAAF7F2|nr:class I SAM-dependent methyltransferase [uncultured Methanoregula sp.]
MADNSREKATVLTDSRYLEITYSAERAPVGIYPSLLARHLMETAYRKTGKLLDIGSGRGDFLDAFSQLGYEVSGVDISPFSSAGAGTRTMKTCNFECEPLPFSENEYDFVFSKSVIEHLHSPHHMISGAFRVLKPGGIAVIMTPSWAHTYWGPFYIDHTHVTPYTIPSLTDVLQIEGFENISTRYFYQLPGVWKHPSLTPLVQLFSLLPFSYRPYHQKARWPDSFNKLIRFSKEVMLIAVCQKPIR